jgi:hypothetical protein
MVTIYCTNKLQKYIGFKENQTGQNNNNSLNSWNAHLFTINKKKCLFFMNQETYFSFVVYDIKKPDIKNLNQLFITGFLFELNKLKLITAEQETPLKENFSGVFLHSSINNRKVIGNMNSHIQVLDFYKYEFEDMQDYFNTETLNKIPLGKKIYFYPLEVMQTKINQLFKGNLRIT